MRADALSPRNLFETTVHYEVPAFQRPYVWSEEDQWSPLWRDIRRVAETVVRASGDKDALSAIGGHFLGAVVLKGKDPVAGDVTRQSVIDGQQRLTTLQVLLDAVHAAALGRGHEVEAEQLEELILNKANRFARRPERLKLWPTRTDRAAFEHAMEHDGAGDIEHRIVEAHCFFRREVEDWLAGKADDDDETPPGQEQDRVEALANVMQHRLFVVAINLTGYDNDQVIFETLNDRGTPLLKADLIKNWAFQLGERVHADVESWPERYWLAFDDTWWREEISQGRHLRARIDIFLQYWLTMREREEILTNDVFRAFERHARPLMTDITTAEKLLGALTRDAEVFRNFAQLSPDTVEGRFYNRVIEAMELASTTPVLLWILSESHAVPADQVDKALGVLESWVIRRTLLRRTMKDVNKFVVAILGALKDVEPAAAGDAIEMFLAMQEADSRRWPTDIDMLALPDIRLYGSVKQSRLRVVLEALEPQLRTELHEAVSVPAQLQVEHVMPLGWRVYWDEEPKLDPKASTSRDHLVNTIGNLTLATPELNQALSNRPWTDAEVQAAGIKGNLINRGLGKHSLLNKYSLLALSREIIDGCPEGWTERDIQARSMRLLVGLWRVWPGPPTAPDIDTS